MKRLIAFIVVGLAFSAVACGGSKEEPKAATAENVQVEETVAPAEEAAPAEAAAPAEEAAPAEAAAPAEKAAAE